MPAISASAPGKIILFGEHAVVYKRPAIAVPVEQVQAKAIVTAAIHQPPGSVTIQAPNINLEALLSDLPSDHSLAAVVHSVFDALNITRPPAMKIRITSTIPIAAGLGSGAAISVAIIRALSDFLGQRLTDERVSSLAYENEKLHHGTPSGIDNNVITYRQPIYFQRIDEGRFDIDTINLAAPLTIVIADTGLPSPTSITVGDVRRAWSEQMDRYEHIFNKIAEIVIDARQMMTSGQIESLGKLMNANHRLLRDLDVSSPKLEGLVKASLKAGALGAKLSGAGRGGNMIALTSEPQAETIVQALQSAGAAQVITTQVKGSPPPVS
jgi:mevalonate kinase